LDYWKAVAENLPESVSINNVYFDRQKFELKGTAATEDQDDVLKFNATLKHVPSPTRPDQLLFGDVGPARINIRGDTAEWAFECQLKEAAGE
jgi:Tfp pilus assembly protein PilN